MKYMLVWSIPPENHEAIVKRFKERFKKDGAKPEAGVKLLGRWHPELLTPFIYLPVRRFFADLHDIRW